MTADDSLTSLAVGFDDGSLVLLRGEVARDTKRHKKMVLLKARPNCRVLGVSFKSGPGGMTWLYAVTTEQVLAFNATQMDRIGGPNVLDQVGGGASSITSTI